MSTQITDAVGCSDSHVSTIVSEYRSDDLRSDGTVEIPTKRSDRFPLVPLGWTLICESL